jgi:hypothetical protein
MSMRAVVVVGLVALLCGAADAAPKKAKKRKGTFAAYIDPSAPDDPPPPPPPPEPKPGWLSIVVLVDRTAETSGAKLDFAKLVIRGDDMATWGDDLIAVLAFNDTVDYVLRPAWAGDARIRKAARKLAPASGSANLASALTETSSYMDKAPNRKVIVLVTDRAEIGDELDEAMRTVRLAHIDVFIVGMPDADEMTLAYVGQEIGARATFTPGTHQDHIDLAEALYNLHYDEPPPNAGRASAGSTTGSARSASPPPPSPMRRARGTSA